MSSSPAIVSISKVLKVVETEVEGKVIANPSSKTFAVGEEAVFDLLIVNPTDNVKVYRIVTDGDVLTASQSVVAVPAISR